MASPAPGGRGQRAQALKRFLSTNKSAYNALVLAIFFGGILLMVLPAELLTFAPRERAELNLEVGGAARPGSCLPLPACRLPRLASWAVCAEVGMHIGRAALSLGCAARQPCTWQVPTLPTLSASAAAHAALLPTPAATDHVQHALFCRLAQPGLHLLRLPTGEGWKGRTACMQPCPQALLARMRRCASSQGCSAGLCLSPPSAINNAAAPLLPFGCADGV